MIIFLVVKCGDAGLNNQKTSYLPVSTAEKKLQWQTTANILYEKNHFLEPIPFWDSLVNIDSLNGEYQYKRAFSNGRAGYREKAISGFKKSAMLNFKKSFSYYNIGVNNSYVDDSTALIYFRKALEEDPSYEHAKLQMESCIDRIAIERIHDGPIRKASNSH